MNTETYTTTEAGTVTLGRTTYRVEIMTREDGTVANTYLHGPRGAVYFLRGFIEKGGDSGRRQVISWKSGQPLRVRGNEVRVHQLGDIIEVI